MHFVTGCVNTAKKAPAQGTGHRPPRSFRSVTKETQKREKSERRTRKKAGEKGLDERVRLQTGCQSVSQSDLRARGNSSSIT